MDPTNSPASLPLMSEAEAAEFLGYTTRFLQERRRRGQGPKFVRISQRAIRYRPEDIRAWIESKLCSGWGDEESK